MEDWIDKLNNDQLNSVLAYLIDRERRQLMSKKNDHTYGTTPIELKTSQLPRWKPRINIEDTEPWTKVKAIADIKKFAKIVENEILTKEERSFQKKWGTIPTHKFQLYTDEQIEAFYNREAALLQAREKLPDAVNAQRIVDSLAADSYGDFDWEEDFEESKNIEQDPAWKPEEKARKEKVKRMRSDWEWESKCLARREAAEAHKKNYKKIMARREIENINWNTDYHISFHPPVGKPIALTSSSPCAYKTTKQILDEQIARLKPIGIQPPEPWPDPLCCHYGNNAEATEVSKPMPDGEVQDPPVPVRPQIDSSVRRSKAKRDHYMKLYGGRPTVLSDTPYKISNPKDPRKIFNLFAKVGEKVVKLFTWFGEELRLMRKGQ